MITASSLIELNNLCPKAAEYIKKNAFPAIGDTDLFEYFLGGECHILETAEEFDILLSSNQKQFDIVEPLDNSNMTVFIVINNNSGGPTYFVPNRLLYMKLFDACNIV